MLEARWMGLLVAVIALACGGAEPRVVVGGTPRRVGEADEAAPASVRESTPHDASETASAEAAPASVRESTPHDASETASAEAAPTSPDASQTTADDETAPPGAPLCALTGDWTAGSLRAPRGGFRYAHVRDGHAEAEVRRREGSARVDVELARAGWRLLGRVDPREDDVLRMAEPSWVREGVAALRAGTTARVLDARPGEVLVAPWRSDGAEREGAYVIDPGGAHARFSASLERWLPCRHVGFSSATRSARDELDALGLVADGDAVVLDAFRRARIAATPGGADVGVLRADEEPLVLTVLERRGRYARVLNARSDSLFVVGWTASSALVPLTYDPGLSLHGRGTGRVSRIWSVCTSAERLTLYAAEGRGPVEHVGFVEPGTRFVRDAAGADGAILIAPHPADGIDRIGEDVTWLVRPSASLQCSEETYPPPPPPVRPAGLLHVRASVTAVSGLQGVAPGAACELTVEHYARNRFCHALVRCGERRFAGERHPHLVLLCQVGTTGEVFVSGDNRGSAVDPNLTIDTRAGTLSIRNSPFDTRGAFAVEAQVESVRAN